MTDEELTDMIAEAIDESMDVDWTSRDGARHVLGALQIANVLPVWRFKPGDFARYDFDPNDTFSHKTKVEIIQNIEGWWLVKFRDGSTCTIRPSLLTPEN